MKQFFVCQKLSTFYSANFKFRRQSLRHYALKQVVFSGRSQRLFFIL